MTGHVGLKEQGLREVEDQVDIEAPLHGECLIFTTESPIRSYLESTTTRWTRHTASQRVLPRSFH